MTKAPRTASLKNKRKAQRGREKAHERFMFRLISPMLALLAVAALAWSSPASAHSLESLQQQLIRKERSFEIKDEPAPDFRLRGVDGEIVSLSDLRGKVIVLNFIGASCEDACQAQARRIAEIQRMVNITPMKDLVAFVTVTTNPPGAATEVPASYGPGHGLDPANWRFLAVPPDEPEDTGRTLAERLGHTFVAADEGGMNGIATHVIDRDGRWRADFHGLGFASINLVLFANALTNSHVNDDHDIPEGQ